MGDKSDSSLCGPMEETAPSIGYPQFSPPGLASSFLSQSLPEPLLSLPPMPADAQNSFQREQHPTQAVPIFPASGSDGSGSEVVFQPAPNSTNTLALRLHHMETLCQDLQREKNVMEDQFGHQRRKFMNLMVQKDEELGRVKRSVEKFSSELQHLRLELKAKEEELQNNSKATKGVESATREAFDADRVKYEEEIASLRRLIDERAGYRKEKDPQSSNVSELQRTPSPGDPSLEGDMAKAVEESRVLKAVVVPLEKEIEDLRLQLWESKEKLKCMGEMQRPDTPPLIDLDAPLSSEPSAYPDKLQHQLELERSARHDLEMHTRALESQKALLQEEVSALKTDLEDVSSKLAVQEDSYQQLQQTWHMANQHFIVAQDKLQQKMYFMEQKQQLLGVASSPNTERLPPVGRRVPSSTQRLSARSYSCDSIREREGSGLLQAAALASELKRVKQRLEQRTATCESYEAQLQRVQEQMLEELDEKDQELSRLREECSKARAGVARERKAKDELRRKMEEACEQFKAQVEDFQSGMETEQTKLKLLKEQYTQDKHEAQRDLARFSDERVSLFAQISSAQEEYDCLKVVQAEETQRYSQHIHIVTQEQTMAEDNVAALQSRLTEIEREKQSLEEDLKHQVTHLNDKLQFQKSEWERLELHLKKQLETARNQIAALEVIKTDLGQEQQMAMAARSDVEEKSRTFIAEQHQKLEVEVAARKAADQMVRDLQRQIASLRSQLNTSQENQKDFVELSQTLQMKLAKIEEEQETSHPS